MRHLARSFIAALIIVLLACRDAAHKTGTPPTDFLIKDSQPNYAATVDTISQKVIDLTAHSDLFHIPEFVSIYENSESYAGEALAVIADSKRKRQEKQIAVLSMQRLPDDRYIMFCDSVVNLFVKDDIESEVLETAVFYSLGLRYQVIRNYKDPGVIRLLNKIRVKTDRQNLKKSINDVLSGDAWHDLSRFLEANDMK